MLHRRILAAALAWGLAIAPIPALAQINVVPQPGVISGYVPKQTFSAVSIGLVVPATPTDVFCITGSSSKVIKVHGIRISASGPTTAIDVPIVILRRATADTGGTAASTTANPANTISKMDTGNAAATATLIAYTANPTINDTSPTYLRVQTLTMAAGTAGQVTPLLFQFSDYASVQGQIPTLRGAAQQLCVNMNGTSGTVTNNVTNIDIQWSEE